MKGASVNISLPVIQPSVSVGETSVMLTADVFLSYVNCSLGFSIRGSWVGGITSTLPLVRVVVTSLSSA